MGILESESLRKRRISTIQKTILRTVAIAGVLSIAVVAPNVLSAMVKIGIVPNKRQDEIIKSSRKKLVERGLLQHTNGLLSLTPKGERELRLIEAGDFKLKKQKKKWDGKWRVLIFDVPEKRKSVRQQIRYTLMSVGFIRLQDSVWVYPYDCEDLITLLKVDFKVGKELLYMIVDSLENDKELKQKFLLIH